MGAYGCGGAQHADLDDIEIVSGGGHFDLICDHRTVDRHEAVAPFGLRIEGHDARDGADPVDPQPLERLEICLQTGPAGGFRTCDHVRNCRHRPIMATDAPYRAGWSRSRVRRARCRVVPRLSGR